ncbi:Leucine aminopeptidase 1 [Entophlyctis luteolus]|nr:Leucine aminopeptidase 1 [Entophlyctis luteolus]
MLFVVLLFCFASCAVVPLQKLLIQHIDDRNAHDCGSIDLAQQGFRLIATSPNQASWMTEEEILALRRIEVGFMDITSQDIENTNARLLLMGRSLLPKHFPPPAGISNEDFVRSTFPDISITRMSSFLSEFSQFHTRYHQSVSGAQSADWLFGQIEAIKPQNSSVSVSIRKIIHSWGQFSIVARIENSLSEKERNSAVSDPIPIAANLVDPYLGRAPGADDDGSGTATIFEAFLILVSSGFVPKRPVEFHWYSAEEDGLLGSQAIAAQYKLQGVEVAGMLQMDMTGFAPSGKDPQIAVITDYTDHQLNEFVRTVAEAYSGVSAIDSKCGYACSDHGSWNKAGFAASLVFEADFKDRNPLVHTPEDTITNIDFSHMAHFVRIAIAFLVEMSLA